MKKLSLKTILLYIYSASKRPLVVVPIFLDYPVKNEALLKATAKGHKDIVEILIENNADVNVSNGIDGTPLFLAMKNNHKEIVKVLLENNADVNAVNYDGWTPIQWAIKQGFWTGYDLELINLLLRYNADVNMWTQYVNL